MFPSILSHEIWKHLRKFLDIFHVFPIFVRAAGILAASACPARNQGPALSSAARKPLPRGRWQVGTVSSCSTCNLLLLASCYNFLSLLVLVSLFCFNLPQENTKTNRPVLVGTWRTKFPRGALQFGQPLAGQGAREAAVDGGGPGDRSMTTTWMTGSMMIWYENVNDTKSLRFTNIHNRSFWLLCSTMDPRYQNLRSFLPKTEKWLHKTQNNVFQLHFQLNSPVKVPIGCSVHQPPGASSFYQARRAIVGPMHPAQRPAQRVLLGRAQRHHHGPPGRRLRSKKQQQLVDSFWDPHKYPTKISNNNNQNHHVETMLNLEFTWNPRHLAAHIRSIETQISFFPALPQRYSVNSQTLPGLSRYSAEHRGKDSFSGICYVVGSTSWRFIGQPQLPTKITRLISKTEAQGANGQHHRAVSSRSDLSTLRP